MQVSPQITEVELSPELLAAFESLQDSHPGARQHEWTKEEDASLLRYWTVKRKADVAKVLGLHDGLCRERYKALTGEK